MQKIFENNIQKQLGDFKIEPSKQTWFEIEKALHPRHKKRGILWWWVPLTGTVITALIIWHFYTNYSSLRNSPPNAQTVKNNTTLATQKKISTRGKDTVQKLLPNIKTNTSENCVEKNGFCTVTHHAVSINNHIRKTTTVQQINGIVNSLNNEEKTIITNNDNFLNNDSAVKKQNEPVIANSTTTSYSGVVIKKEENKNQSLTKKDSSVSVTKQPSNKNMAQKKNKWMFVAEGGFLNINKNIFPGINNSQSYASAPSNSSGGSSSSPSAYTTSPDKGFAFSLGIYRQTQLSEHWYFETGFLYRYFQNKQTVGNKKDTSSSQQFNLSGNYYYQAGQNTDVVNYAHSIEIPLLMNYIINPKQKNKFYLQAGIEAGYLFAKKWMITDETNNLYYYKNSLINNFQLNMKFGIGINFYNKLQTNVNFMQSATPLYKINNNKIYTNQISLQLLIPVSLKNKK